MKSLVILLAITALTYAAENCLVYTCKDDLPKEVCSTKVINPTNITYLMKACEGDNKVCDVRLKEKDQCADFYDQKLSYPGEYCRNDKECFKGNCPNETHVCTLNPGNTTCEDDLDCNPGLFCKSGNCVKQRMFNESCGKEDRCHPSFACNDSVCIKIGSGENGQKASSPLVCKSFYIEEGVCKEGPKLTNYTEDGLKCPESNLCTYTIDKHDFTDKCRCGRSGAGVKYCQPGRGDIDMQDYWDYADSKKDEKECCHISKGLLTASKASKDWDADFAKAYLAYTRSSRWVLFYENEPCVQKVMDPEYWNAVDAAEEDDDKFGLYLFLGVAIGAVVVIAVLLLVIYMRKAKPEGEDEQDTLKATAT